MAGATVPFWIDAGSQLLILVVMFVVLWRSRMQPRKDAEWEPWVDLDRIDGEIEALIEFDPAQAERWFLNRKLAGEAAAVELQTVPSICKDLEMG